LVLTFKGAASLGLEWGVTCDQVCDMRPRHLALRIVHDGSECHTDETRERCDLTTQHYSGYILFACINTEHRPHCSERRGVHAAALHGFRNGHSVRKYDCREGPKRSAHHPSHLLKPNLCSALRHSPQAECCSVRAR
jgi:hypothetical protein